MILLIIRHGIAEDRDEFAASGKPDDLRPLTSEGRTKMKHAAEGLKEIASEISILASSPLVRAHETAEIVARAYDIEVRATTETLRPEAPLEKFLEWLTDRSEQPVVAIVGHEPHLSTLATWFMTGTKESQIELKKGGACLLTFQGAPKPGAATLDWLMHPSHLRALAGRGW
jgi:phosphohistidine phosphatase